MSSQESGTPAPDKPPADTGGNPERQPPVNELPRWATKQSSATPFSENRMGAYFGPRWDAKYRAKLTPFFTDPSFTASWNWSAALGYPFWFLYRKLYATFALFIALSLAGFGFLVRDFDPTALLNPESPEVKQLSTIVLAVTLSLHVLAGGSANWFLFRRVRAASYGVMLQQVPEDVALSRLQRLGGVNVKAVVIFFVISVLMAMVFSKPGVQ